MKNKEAIAGLCTAVASSFYPDTNVVEMTAHTLELDPEGEAQPRDPLIFRCALLLVRGYIEGSRSEGGMSVSVRSEEAIKNSLVMWCDTYGLNPEEELGDYLRVIENGSNLW